MFRYVYLLPILHLVLGNLGRADAQPTAAQDDVPAMLAKLKGNLTRSQQSSLLFNIGQAGDIQATPAILDYIATHSGALRISAIRCFSKLRDPRAVEPLLKLLQDRESLPKAERTKFAVTVVFALGNQQDRRAAPALLEILRQPTEEAELRRYTAQALGEISDPAGNRRLVEMLADRSLPEAERCGVAKGLGYFRAAEGGPTDAPNEAQVAALLIEVVSRDDEPFALREEAAKALGRFGNPDAIEPLCRVAEKNPEGSLGFWAAVSAVKISDGKLNNVAVVKALRNYYTNPEGDGDTYEGKKDSLEKLAANGGWQVGLELSDVHWPDVEPRTLLLVLAIVGSAMWLLVRRKKNARAPAPSATFDETVAKPDP